MQRLYELRVPNLMVLCSFQQTVNFQDNKIDTRALVVSDECLKAEANIHKIGEACESCLIKIKYLLRLLNWVRLSSYSL